jgi:uncharacterized protein (DUF4415 family)
MTESRRKLGSDLAKVDATTDEDVARHMAEDDTPELTDAQLAEAEVYEGDKFIRRVGRPKGSGTKELVTLRLDRAVLERFRADGPGWQTRLNDALRGHIAPSAARRSRRVKRISAGHFVVEQSPAEKLTMVRDLARTNPEVIEEVYRSLQGLGDRPRTRARSRVS